MDNPVNNIDPDKWVIVKRQDLVEWKSHVDRHITSYEGFVDRWDAAINQLLQAIDNEVDALSDHQSTMMRHRYEWSTLWAAIDKLVEVARG